MISDSSTEAAAATESQRMWPRLLVLLAYWYARVCVPHFFAVTKLASLPEPHSERSHEPGQRTAQDDLRCAGETLRAVSKMAFMASSAAFMPRASAMERSNKGRWPQCEQHSSRRSCVAIASLAVGGQRQARRAVPVLATACGSKAHNSPPRSAHAWDVQLHQCRRSCRRSRFPPFSHLHACMHAVPARRRRRRSIHACMEHVLQVRFPPCRNARWTASRQWRSSTVPAFSEDTYARQQDRESESESGQETQKATEASNHRQGKVLSWADAVS